MIIQIGKSIYKYYTKLKYARRIRGCKNAFFTYSGIVTSQYVKNPQNIEIGDNFYIGKDFLLGVFSDTGHIIIGNNVGCQQRVRISAWEEVIIGDNVLMGSDVFISDNNHGKDAGNEQPYGKQPISSSPVSIGDECWIGEKVIILSGVHIGKRCVIGAGSVVTRSIPDYCMAVGNPARVIKRWIIDSGWVRV